MEGRLQEDGAEDDERGSSEQRAELLEEVPDLAADPPPDGAEHGPADEGRDEPRAAERGCRGVREGGCRNRHDLEPRALDEPSRAGENDDRSAEHAGGHPCEPPVPALSTRTVIA